MCKNVRTLAFKCARNFILRHVNKQMKGVVDVVRFNRKWVMGAEDRYSLNIHYRESKHSDTQSYCPVYYPDQSNGHKLVVYKVCVIV